MDKDIEISLAEMTLWMRREHDDSGWAVKKVEATDNRVVVIIIRFTSSLYSFYTLLIDKNYQPEKPELITIDNKHGASRFYKDQVQLLEIIVNEMRELDTLKFYTDQIEAAGYTIVHPCTAPVW